jgi:hypothetical protein
MLHAAAPLAHVCEGRRQKHPKAFRDVRGLALENGVILKQQGSSPSPRRGRWQRLRDKVKRKGSQIH